MAIPLLQKLYVGGYVVRQHLAGRKRYPLVLMLEPLFRCNLACAGCGKIDYPDKILNQRLSVEECLARGRRMRRAGGLDRRRRAAASTAKCPKIVEGIIARKKFVYRLHQRAADGEEARPIQAQPVSSSGRCISTATANMHDHSVCEDGVYDKAVAAVRKAKARGFRVSMNCTLFDNADPERVASFFDSVKGFGIDGITVSPGYAYERAPDQEHFLNRTRTKQLFRDIFRRGQGTQNWSFNQSSLFLDFLAGNQEYHCTPWGNPTRNVFGWQRPCYLLGEGYVRTFKELMEETDWDTYGTGNYEKCADCMVHCGYEATAVMDAVRHPLKALGVALRGVETEKPMAPEIALDKQRPAQYVFANHVEKKLGEIGKAEATAKAVAGAR